MLQNATKTRENEDQSYVCQMCDYHTSENYNFKRHLSTDKHLKRQNANKMLTNATKTRENEGLVFSCQCGKTYKHRTTLYRHNLTCLKNEGQETKQVSSCYKDDLIIDLLKQNSELQNSVVELLKTGTHNTTNSNNKTFNLQFFLNDTCKDAMNITDFVKNIQIQMDDFEKVGEIGYVNGISNIIIKNLKDMDISTRPIHCTDAKRDTLYVKDENKWDKETTDNPKIRNAIKHIAHNNCKLITEFKEKNPECTKSASNVSDKYNKLMIECMGGKGDNIKEKENKIIKNISKETML